MDRHDTAGRRFHEAMHAEHASGLTEQVLLPRIQRLPCWSLMIRTKQPVVSRRTYLALKPLLSAGETY